MQLDETTLKSIVAKAIFDGITPENREKLLSEAITSLLTAPPPGRYGETQRPSPLASIFENEVSNLAREAVRERFKTDPAVKEMVSALVTKSIAAMAENDDVSSGIANLIAAALRKANSSY